MVKPLTGIVSSSQLSDSDDDNLETRSPSSPPPPPPNHTFHSERPPRAPLLSQPHSTAAPSNKPKTTQRSRVGNGSRAAAQSEERARRKAEREQQRALKQAAQQEARQKRIRAAFEGHQSTSLGRQSSVKILVSESMFNDKSPSDPLKRLRLIYPAQIICVQRPMSGLVTWQRLQVNNGTNANELEDVPICVFIFRAEEYLLHIASETLDDCAKEVKSACLTMHKIVFVVCGMNRECARRARLGIGLFGEKDGSVATDKRAIQDSYVHLYMEHSIRTHDAQDLEELCNYLCDVTDAIAAAPFKQEQDYVSASLRSRVAYANVSCRTVVFESSQPQQDSNEDVAKDIMESSCEPKLSNPQVRVEGSRDLGNIYLSMLCMIPGVTVRKAQAIREHYPTLRLLLDAYDKCSTETEREQVLADVRAGDHNRRLGPALSKAIANVLTSVDPNMAVKRGALATT